MRFDCLKISLLEAVHFPQDREAFSAQREVIDKMACEPLHALAGEVVAPEQLVDRVPQSPSAPRPWPQDSSLSVEAPTHELKLVRGFDPLMAHKTKLLQLGDEGVKYSSCDFGTPGDDIAVIDVGCHDRRRPRKRRTRLPVSECSRWHPTCSQSSLPCFLEGRMTKEEGP